MATDTSPLTPQSQQVSPWRGLIDVFVSPGALFTRLRDRPHWLIPLLALCIVMVAQQYVLYPFTQRAMLGSINDQMPAAMAQAYREGAHKPFGVMNAISPLFGVAIFMLLGAGILTGLAAMFTGKGGFKALFASLAYAKLITIPALVLSALVVYLRGLDSVNSMVDIMWTIGPAIFIGENKLLFNIFSQINLFEIWYLIVLVIAVRKVTGNNGAGATAAVVIYWLLGAVTQIVTLAFTMGLK